MNYYIFIEVPFGFLVDYGNNGWLTGGMGCKGTKFVPDAYGGFSDLLIFKP